MSQKDRTHLIRYLMLGLALALPLACSVDPTQEDNRPDGSLPMMLDGQADFTISGITKPIELHQGATGSATVTVANGGTDAGAPGTVNVYLSTDQTCCTGDTYVGTVTDDASLAPSGSRGEAVSITAPPYLATGDYYVVAKVDANDQTTELDENNNTGSSSTTLQVSPRADLFAESVIGDPTLVRGLFRANAYLVRVENLGPIGFGGWTRTRIFLSTDQTCCSGDIDIGNIQNQGAPSIAVFYVNVIVPATASTGFYNLFAVADADGNLDESVETNNQVMRVGQVNVTATSLPDLTAGTVTASGGLTAGIGATLSVSLSNIGTSATSGTFTVRTYLSTNATYESGTDVQIGSETAAQLADGTTRTDAISGTIPSSVPTGAYYLIAVADPTNAVTEGYEGNNVGVSSATTWVDPAGVPDLRVTSVTGPSTVPLYATSAVGYTVSVRNWGTVEVPSGTGWILALAMSSDQAYSSNDPRVFGGSGPAPLSPYGQLGDAGVRSTFFAPPAGSVPGPVYLVANLDTTNAISESDEGNNTGASAAITLTANGDMRVDSLTGPASIGPGAGATVPVFVKNYGTDPARPAKVKVYLSTDNVLSAGDSLIGSLTDTPLMTAGTVRTENVSVTIAAAQAVGNYYLIAKVDADSTVYESNEGNNTMVRTSQVSIAVPSLPDLIVNSMIPQIDTAWGGNSYQWITGTARNNGTATAASGWKGRLYLSTNTTWDGGDILVASTTFGSLAASTNVSIATTATVPSASGNYYLIYVVDATGVTTESNEGNNVSVSSGTVYVDLP